MQYGLHPDRFYIAESFQNHFRLSQPGFLASGGMWMSRREMEQRHAIYLGHGRRKWYWPYLPWKNTVPPFHRPNAAGEPQPTCDSRKPETL